MSKSLIVLNIDLQYSTSKSYKQQEILDRLEVEAAIYILISILPWPETIDRSASGQPGLEYLLARSELCSSRS